MQIHFDLPYSSITQYWKITISHEYGFIRATVQSAREPLMVTLYTSKLSRGPGQSPLILLDSDKCLGMGLFNVCMFR
jgi:hypothetical protein